MDHPLPPGPAGDDEPGRYNNRGQAVAGQVCSIIGIALGGLALLAAIVLLAVAIGMAS